MLFSDLLVDTRKDFLGIRLNFETATRTVTRLRNNLRNIVKGHEEAIDLLIVALLARGHVLLESVPGEGKTLLASTLAASLADVSAGRLSGQPTLKPSDLLGAEIATEVPGEFRLIKGPVFNNILLFDELNRTDPRTQSALLEAMQELQVTIGDVSVPLPQPFHVIATQNPLSHEGTWELDAAAKQRFLLKIDWTFSSRAVEVEIAKQSKTFIHENLEALEPAMTGTELHTIQTSLPALVELPDEIIQLMTSVIVATRRSDPSYPADAFEASGYGADVISPAGGASSRTTAFWPPLLRAHAFFRGRRVVAPVDVFATAHSLLNHRIETTYPVDIHGVLDVILAERGYGYDYRA